MKFKINYGSSIFMDCVFDTTGNFTIGTNSVINAKCRIDNRGKITIGDNVSISQEVVILTADHQLNSPGFEGQVRPVTIDNYAWIGTRAMILPGCIIGKGAVIAAGAVVTKSVPPFSVMAGVPAKFVRSRNENINYQFSYRRLFQ
jgi:maltose O-acetyltransferase